MEIFFKFFDDTSGRAENGTMPAPILLDMPSDIFPDWKYSFYIDDEENICRCICYGKTKPPTEKQIIMDILKSRKLVPSFYDYTTFPESANFKIFSIPI